MSVFVHGYWIKTVHARGGSKMAKFCPRSCWMTPSQNPKCHMSSIRNCFCPWATLDFLRVGRRWCWPSDIWYFISRRRIVFKIISNSGCFICSLKGSNEKKSVDCFERQKPYCQLNLFLQPIHFKERRFSPSILLTWSKYSGPKRP